MQIIDTTNHAWLLRRPQFILASRLVARFFHLHCAIVQMLLFAIVSYAEPPRFNELQSQIAHIRSLGGKIDLTQGFITLRFTKAFDADLENIKLDPKVRRLDLSNARITDKVLGYLRELPDLEDLGLAGTEICGKGLVHLKNLKRLKRLSLESTTISNHTLGYLPELPAIENLSLRHNHISDQGLKSLKDLTTLKRLDLSYTDITGDGLPHLRTLTNLQKLSLRRTQVGDKGIRYLTGLSKLETLNLRDTVVTDGCIMSLQQLTALKWLDASNTRLTETGFKSLKMKLPELITNRDVYLPN